MKKKIIVTVGPSSLNGQTIKKMDVSGVDIFRINLSHTPEELIEKHVRLLQSWTNKTICLDTEGAQLRTGRIPGGETCLQENQIVYLLPRGANITEGNQIPLSVENISELFYVGDLIKIDFNSALLQIIEIEENLVRARMLRSGKIGSNKGCSSDRVMDLPAFTSKDMAAAEIAKCCGIDTFAFSFAASGEDVKEFRRLFDYPVKIISKIESKCGLLNIENISANSDALLIDRGDLSRDVPLEKVIFAQNYIIAKGKILNIPIYVATNLMENMVLHSKPTRSEVHDIISTLKSGADGMVLAAETAIGAYPVECVRIMSRLINEYMIGEASVDIKYLTELPSDRMIVPHGNSLVQQLVSAQEAAKYDCPSITVSDEILADMRQIAVGTYSPLKGFMDLDELHSTLDNYSLPDGTTWTLPVLFQLTAEQASGIPHSGASLLVKNKKGEVSAILNVRSVSKIEDMKKITEKWFGTSDIRHPGVNIFLNSGEYILSGDVFWIDRKAESGGPCYILTPKQTREIFNDFNWHRIVGFHTRNVVHRGHEHIQKAALEKANADALFISPVVGKKKSGDFSSAAIIACYEKLIQCGVYKPYGVLLGAFDTHSRYSGPREAAFTAICRKNFGCSHFIVGRDHTGVGNFYGPDASIKLLESLDLGIEILSFDTVYYCKCCNGFTFGCGHAASDAYVTLSGTELRKCIVDGKQPPEYLVRAEVFEILSKLYEKSPDALFFK